MKENSIEEDIKILEEFIDGLRQYNPKTGKDIKPTQFGEGQRYVYSNVCYAIDHILSDHKRILKENEQLRTEVNSLLKENEELNKNYNSLIDKIILKIDEYDYKFKKAKKQNKNDIADYYWDLIINFKKIVRW